MDERIVYRVADILIARFDYLGPSKFSIDQELKDQKDPVTRRDLTLSEKAEVEKKVLDVIRYKRSHDGAILVPVSVVSDPKVHEEWYEEWLAKNNDEEGSYYWKRLESYLRKIMTCSYDPERAGRIVRSVDESTIDIIRKLSNPQRSEFSCKGLVVGYVQSGKTANFSVLIAKAVDAGYKFIIVLAGIHDILRLQTQIRLDKELTGMNDLGLSDDFISQPSDAKNWNRLTTAYNDFTYVNLGPFSTYCIRSTPTIAIIKKNCPVMEKLIRYINQANEEDRRQMPVLIIDDEADQASIDTNARNPDTEPSRTNEYIRTLLSLFPRKGYIGYTATPFANVLIDMTAEHDRLEDDLYPRNFIASLPQPQGYFGTSTIFRGALADSFVREIPDERNALTSDHMTESLMRAIDEFIICCAIRNIRNDRLKPMSMLVHVSHRIGDMTIIRGLVDDYLRITKERFRDTHGKGKLQNDYHQLWKEFDSNARELNRILELNNHLPQYDSIWHEIGNVLEAIRTVELNSASEDVLDYTANEEIKIIAIGGNQLSRGLTLEGLMTSYYLRPSKQYDTLLQMARWFGYRMGYEDLTRVHSTAEIWDGFQHLALVEEELRSEIYRYEEEGKTPAEMAIAIRDHRRLNVTAPNKMGAAHLRQTSYSESLNQTIWLPLNQPEIMSANYNLGESFVRRINDEYGFGNINNCYLAKKIPGEFVLQKFLNRYNFVSREFTGGPGLDSERLLAYIYRRLNDERSELREWSVALLGNENPVRGSDDPVIYGGLSLNKIQRSRKHTDKGYNIGVLTEPDHLRIDLKEDAKDPYDGRSPQNPMLLLYLIWRESKAVKYVENPQPNQRIDLYRFISTEKVDALGLAIVLPRSKYEPNDYIGQQI